MAERPRIGVTGGAKRFSPSWWCTWLALRLCGARPYRISVKHNVNPRRMHALVVGGGDDIHPELYNGEYTASEEYDRARDALETRCLKMAMDEGIPILGICRGAQLMNVVCGGSLFADIRRMRVRTSNRRQLLATKKIFVEPGSLLKKIGNRSTMKVNSLHYQAVDRCGDNIFVSARDSDNIVQAIEYTPPSHDKASGIGVQWHPEYLFYLPSHFTLFRWLKQNAAVENNS